MANNQGEVLTVGLIGKTIAGILCENFYVLNDIVVVQDAQKNAKALKLSSLADNPELHLIDEEGIKEIQVANNGKMFLFHTQKKLYLVNDQNKIVEDSAQWKDVYFDELSSSIFRRGPQGHWYDLEGFVMNEKVFLKDTVLICLETRKSKQSLSFKNQEVFISENRQLIQVGKIVLDLHLEIVKYFGEKITGLGKAHISFEGKDVLQEVMLGLEDTAFINEYTHEPYMLGDAKIIKHEASHQYGKKRVEVFQTDKRSFGVEGSSDNFLTYNDRTLDVESQKHLNFNEAELIKVNDGKNAFFFNLNKYEPFSLPAIDDKILSDIDKQYVRIGNSKIYNVASSREQFVVYEKDGEIFKLDEGTIRPQKIEDVEALNKHYGFATVDGVKKLFLKSQSKILKFGKDALEVSEIMYNAPDKLINAIDTNGNKLVLDIRHGYDEITLAITNGEKISETYGDKMQVGNKTLQNVYVESLGGNTKRVIDSNDESLACFTIPEDMGQISYQETRSLFAGNFICEIFFDKERVIEGKKFVSADFEAFSGRKYAIILDKETGKPLHLPGLGHRNELATSFIKQTSGHPIYLGNNRMVGVKTLGEDLKEHQLIFSVQQLTSWLPFYDKYLPIFMQVVTVKDDSKDAWNYHLFELAEVSKDKEYIVVEKVSPYRILAHKKSGEYQPRIVKSKNKALKSPEDLNALLRFFLDSGVLVDIE